MIDKSPYEVLHKVFYCDDSKGVIDEIILLPFFVGKGRDDKVTENVLFVVGGASPCKELRKDYEV